VASVAKTWGLDLVDAVYFAEGGGSYHWVVTTADGIRHFVTVDDLDEKRFLGDTREGTFTALRSAFDTAFALGTSGLDFVVAPRRTSGGETVHRIGARYSVALFPFIEGTPGSFGVVLPPEERAALVHLLASLHAATPLVVGLARDVIPEIPGRQGLESPLHELDREWSGGPYSEEARALLSTHAPAVLSLLETFDRLSDQVR